MIKKFKVKWNYRSSLGGPWMKGDIIELEESVGEAVNRDSPGVLVAVAEKVEKKVEENLTERIVEGAQDRMVRGKGKR